MSRFLIKKIVAIVLISTLFAGTFPVAIIDVKAAQISWDGSSSGKKIEYDNVISGIEQAGNGGIIKVTGAVTLNDKSINGSGSTPLMINRSVTIEGTGSDSKIVLWAGGIILGADVTFKNITLSFANTDRNSIIANGHTLTLDNVKCESGTQGINLFTGGIIGYQQSEVTVPPVSNNGQIIINNGYSLGNGCIFAGNHEESMFDESPKPYEGNSTIDIVGMKSNEKIPAIYSCGALRKPGKGIDMSGSKVEPPTPNIEKYQTTGNVSIKINSSSIQKVDAAQGGDKYADVVFKDTTSFSGTLVGNVTLENIKSLAVESGYLEPAAGSNFVSGGKLSLSSNAKLSLLNMNSDIIKDEFDGNGTLILGLDQKLTITGNVSGKTHVAVSELKTNGGSGTVIEDWPYIIAKNSTNQSFILGDLPYAQSNLIFSKNEAGEWKATKSGSGGGEQQEDIIKVKTISIDNVASEPIDPNAPEISYSMPITVEFSEDTDWPYLDGIKLNSVLINGEQAKPYTDTEGYIYYATGSYISPNSLSVQIIDNVLCVSKAQGGSLNEGTYNISFYIPKEHTESDKAMQVKATLKISTSSDSGGQNSGEQNPGEHNPGEQNPVIKYRIVFSGNGATSGNITPITDVKNDQIIALSPNGFRRTGYVFSGWNTKPDGKGTSYADKARVSNLSNKNGASVTLFAKWSPIEYKVSYVLNGGTQNSKNNRSYYANSPSFNLLSPTKKGYTFGGWYLNKNFSSSSKITRISAGSVGDKTVFAKWTENKYSIVFNKNGAKSGKMTTLSKRKYGIPYKLPSNIFKRKGYKFVGWNTKKNGKGKKYSNKSTVKNLTSVNGGKVTLYAQWKKAK